MILSIAVVRGTELGRFGKELKSAIEDTEKSSPGKPIELQYQTAGTPGRIDYSCMIIVRSRS